MGGILAGVVVALLAAGVLYQRVGLTRQRRQFAPPGQLIDVGGHRLHVTCRGAGSPIVFFESGIAASSLSWSLVAPAVAMFTRACAYDRAGLGWSEAPSSKTSSSRAASSDAASSESKSRAWSFERIVHDHCALLDRLGPNEKYVLVGHSFGSFVVRAVAMRRPEQIAGLVLVDPATEWLTATPQRLRHLRGGQQLSRVGAMLAHVGVVRACLDLLTGGAPGAPRTSSRSSGRPPRIRSNGWSARCASCRRSSIRRCARCGVSRSASTPWPITSACSNAAIR
jgi:pimeloyl-ACP methyl ester carboxylesterase